MKNNLLKVETLTKYRLTIEQGFHIYNSLQSLSLETWKKSTQYLNMSVQENYTADLSESVVPSPSPWWTSAGQCRVLVCRPSPTRCLGLGFVCPQKKLAARIRTLIKLSPCKNITTLQILKIFVKNTVCQPTCNQSYLLNIHLYI